MLNVSNQWNQTCVQIDSERHQVFSPKSLNNQYVFNIYSNVVAQAVVDVEKTALAAIRSASVFQKTLGAFRITLDAVQHSSNEFFQAYISRLEEAEKSPEMESQMVEALEISLENLKESTVKAKIFAERFFYEHFREGAIFPYKTGKEDIEKFSFKTLVASCNYLYEQLGMQKGRVCFSEEILQVFGVSKNEITVEPTTLNCLCYALFKARVIQAKDLIFQLGADDAVLRNLFHHLKEWDYEEVCDPKKGDLVVYLQDNKARLVDGPVKHVGVYAGNGKVLSKMGIANRYAHVHGIFDIETQAIFFSKKSSIK